VHAQTHTHRERERVRERESSSVWICAILIYSVVSSKSLIKKERQGKPKNGISHKHKAKKGRLL